MILESLHLIKAYSARAMNYLESYSISKDDLLSVAANFPGMLLHIRACAIKLSNPPTCTCTCTCTCSAYAM
tara:strand:- start:1109 stop:1321 length:213 start_codon:yes stop_codon:yes gene_type:complete